MLFFAQRLDISSVISFNVTLLPHFPYTQVLSPTHHKSPTVAGSFERDFKVPVPVRPHSTHIQGYNIGSYTIPESTGISSELQAVGKAHLSNSQLEAVRLSPLTTNPLKVSSSNAPLDGSAAPMTQPLLPDGGAPPSLASAPDTKSPREIKESKLRESLSTSAAMSIGEKELRGRKGSEPPPSLQALFPRDGMGSSRRWANRQFSVDELHLKQHSFDSSHLQSQSPKLYARRVKSPSMSDKNTTTTTTIRAETVPVGGGEGEGSRREAVVTGKDAATTPTTTISLHHTPSHPHLTSSPQVLHSLNVLSLQESQPLARSHSTQQLKMEADNDEKAQLNLSKVTKSSSNGSSNADLPTHHSEAPSGLKLMKDRELSQSKESLNSTKDSQFGPGMKRTASRESLKGKEPSSFSKVIQTPVKELTTSTSTGTNVGTTGSVGMSLHDLNKENRERSAPSKDTQSSAEGSVENMQAPLFQQVSMSLPPCVCVIECVCTEWSLCFNYRALPQSMLLNSCTEVLYM